VKTFWHPLSTLLLSEPRCFATTGLVRMLSSSDPRLQLIYCGDRMWPTLQHGARFTVETTGEGKLAPGTVVLVERDGIPDLLRVARDDDESVSLVADADPAMSATVSRREVLGRACLPRLASNPRRTAWRRRAIDLREAWHERPDPAEDPATTVLDKYESQATYYAQAGGQDIDPALRLRIRERLSSGASVLVVGSGAGRESFALTEDGLRVVGIEFSPAMVRSSATEASRRGLDVAFLQADVREHAAERASLDGVLFTYDVYSFLPGSRERVELLRRIRSWLRPGGSVFLSARRLLSVYDRLILSLQWLALQRSGEAEWGDSHTRWIPDDGRLCRSFVHLCSEEQLRHETSSAGFRMGRWEGGHSVLTAGAAAIIPD
jgi:2-polyprenyl-3-methyl-5-hydroxy-6-metoxy-1,4-benzoquinol methylase